jgi:hypothetical protein
MKVIFSVIVDMFFHLALKNPLVGVGPFSLPSAQKVQ